jgi:hypothetical protein
MLIKDVKKLSPQEIFIYWIKERESIRRKKEAGKKKPWTDDEILLTYKFCNVRRMDDRVSQWLYENWYKPNYDHKNTLLACTLAREFNNPDSLEEIGYPTQWKPKQFKKKLDARFERGLKNYSGAYMVTGTLGGTKNHQVINIVGQTALNSKINIYTDTMEECWRSLLPLPGFSSFIAGQVASDVRWAANVNWPDRLTWAPAGPGSKRGLNKFLERPKGTPMNQDKFLSEFEAVRKLISKKVPKIFKRLEAIDMQSCLCEFDKYTRTLHGDGRPRSKYPGAE